MSWYMPCRVHTTVICQNLENQHLRLGTKCIHVRLILMIPTIVRSSQGTNERLRIYSLGWVFGRLSACVASLDFAEVLHLSTLLYPRFLLVLPWFVFINMSHAPFAASIRVVFCARGKSGDRCRLGHDLLCYAWPDINLLVAMPSDALLDIPTASS